MQMGYPGQGIDEDQVSGNFTQSTGQRTGGVTIGLAHKKVGWKMGFAFFIAVMPAKCFEWVDGLIDG